MRLTKQQVQQALDWKIKDHDSGAKSPRDYFKKLLLTLWEEGESFSGKRPFGNSGWDWDLALDLTNAGYLLAGKPLAILDDDGFIEDLHPEYDVFIDALIKGL